jgi:endonuclease-3
MKSEIAIKQLKELKKLIIIHSEKPRLAAEGWDEEWKTLIAIMLSAQTRDTKTIEVSNELFKKYSSAKKLGEANLKEIENQIRSINYYKTKAKHIKETSQILSKIRMPETVEELIKLPGVGRKTANVFLVEARNAAAIGVDTHVSRIAIKLEWTNKKFEDKEGIEKDLEKLFPKRYWNSINYILVTFGQTYGRSRKQEDEIFEKVKKIK